MKTIQDETRNLTIEEITKLEADTIGISFFAKGSPLPFRDDEAPTKYQNLLSGNDRTVNRELFVHFERRNRDIVEYIVKRIIPSGQSVFMAQQTDSGIKDFLKKSDERIYAVSVWEEEKKNTVSDDKARSTDWITYFNSLDFAEIPVSLSEDVFIKSVYQIFSYQVFPLRLQYHLENEGIEELSKIAEEHLHLIRYRVIDFTYPLQINELINNPTDLEALKKEFKSDVFDTFADFCDAVHYLFGFYSHLCARIADYERTKDEITRQEKWVAIFRQCAYNERKSSYYDSTQIKNEQFLQNLEILRSPDFLPVIEKEFANDSDNEFFLAFRNEGASALVQKASYYGTKDFNSFFVPFINALIEIVNSLSSCTQKVERIANIEDIDSVVKAIAPKSFFDSDFSFDKSDEKPHLEVESDKLSESEKRVFYAISSIASSLRDGLKKYSENLNGKRWFSFMRSLVNDKAFCMKEEQKTKNFVRFQNELLSKSYNSHAFNDFVSQLTGVFEYSGFVSCIDIALESLESLKILDNNDEENWRGYKYLHFKTSFDFIENALKSIREKAACAERGKNDYPEWRHRLWCNFLSSLHSDESFRVDKLPERIDEWYFDEKTCESKQKYDGKTSFKPLNLADFRDIFGSISYSIPKTVATVLSDIFRVNDVYSVRHENTLLDKYKYLGLMAQSPFIHSSVALFYRFLYGFFTLLRTNISTLVPYNLPQTKILEYSLSSYIASYVSNTQDIRDFTRTKHFVSRYFEKKGGEYRSSMKSANIALKTAAKKEGLAITESFKELANFTDTKHKGDDLKNTPATSAYVLNEILERDDLFPKELFPRAVKKYREDYLNYYLLCNFIKAVSPYFAERTESIFSEIVEGILRYTFYHPDEYKKRSIESGFDYLLHQSFEKNNFDRYDTCVCYRYQPFVRYPVYFWYSEQKDDRLYKSIQRFSYDCAVSVDFSDRELALKQIEFMRDEFGRGTGDFYYNYYHGLLEYRSFKAGDKKALLKNVVEYYEKAFRFIYSAGRDVDNFVTAVFDLYKPIRESQRLYEERKEALKLADELYKNYPARPRQKYSAEERERAEQIYKQEIEWRNKQYGFDLSLSTVRDTPILPLKRIWQWAEAAGLVDRSYENISGRVRSNVYGDSMWEEARYRLGDSDSKVVNNIEKLIADLESEE